MHNADSAADSTAGLQFSQPIRQILTMLVIIGVVGTSAWFAYKPILTIVMSNIYLNGFIVAVFLIGITTCFWQVFSLITSVSWIEGFAMDRAGHEYVTPPRLLVSLATLLKGRGARKQISASSSDSILDSIATRLDETREITRYISNILILLGLLGTFYGLATTVPAVVETIRSLAPVDGETATDVFGRLMTGLEKQLGGMGTAFSSSLLGLAGSLVVGLLDLFAGHGQNRFYRELEEWLSTITQVGFSASEIEGQAATGERDSGAATVAFHRMAESVEELHKTFIRAEDLQSETSQRIGLLTQSLARLAENMGKPVPPDDVLRKAILDQNQLLSRIAEGQEKISGLAEAKEEESVDAESRMRLRSIDVQLLRILEEMSAGRQDTVAELRADIAALNKAVRSLNRRPPTQPNVARERG